MHGITHTVFFGTTPGGNSGSRGIYATAFDSGKGRFDKPVQLVADVQDAGFVTWHPKLQVLYSLNGANVASFVPDSGDSPPVLTLLNRIPTEAGKGTHLDTDPQGKVLVTAHYGNGTVAIFPLLEDGRIGEVSQVIQLEAFSTANEGRQGKPHPHSANFDPSARYVLVPDLGADTTYIFACDVDKAKLTLHGQADSAPGAGPRHMKFSANGKFAYILNELDLTIDVFEWDSCEGKLSHIQTIATLSEEEKALNENNTASEIRIHPSGRFAYSANRGHNSISVFEVKPETGKLDQIQVVNSRVNWPRNFDIDPLGKWILCAGQWSNDVTVFSINQETGALSFCEGSGVSVPGPICVEFKK